MQFRIQDMLALTFLFALFALAAERTNSFHNILNEVQRTNADNIRLQSEIASYQSLLVNADTRENHCAQMEALNRSVKKKFDDIVGKRIPDFPPKSRSIGMVSIPVVEPERGTTVWKVKMNVPADSLVFLRSAIAIGKVASTNLDQFNWSPNAAFDDPIPRELKLEPGDQELEVQLFGNEGGMEQQFEIRIFLNDKPIHRSSLSLPQQNLEWSNVWWYENHFGDPYYFKLDSSNRILLRANLEVPGQDDYALRVWLSGKPHISGFRPFGPPFFKSRGQE